MRTEARLFLKQHAGAEHRLADAVAAFFDDQRRRLVVELEDFDTVPAASHVFRADDEHAVFMASVRPHLVASMGIGAATQLELGTSKAFVDDALRNFKLPQRVLDVIEGHWTDLESQPYWRDIQATTETRVTAVLDETIDAGLGPRAAGKLISERLGPVFSKERANAIARTETTGAMNAGTMAGMEDLAADGLLSGKAWNSIPDRDRRVSHEAAHGQTVGVREMFKVPLPTPTGGRRRRRKELADGFEMAPFPGHWQLSAGNRVNCRCTILAALSDEKFGAE